MTKELENIGRTWGEAKQLANNIVWWLWLMPYDSRGAKRITVKALLSPRGAYLILGLKKRGLIREGGLIERGGLFQIINFRENSLL